MLMRGYWPQGNDGQPRAVTPRGDLMDLEKTTIDIYNNAKPSVVHITTLAVQRDRWNLNVQQVPEGTGSGFVWDKDGHIVTNFHVVQSVVQNNGAVQVTLADQSNWRRHGRRLLPRQGHRRAVHRRPGRQADADPDRRARRTCKSASRRFAIGNPFGLDHTLTDGIVSATGREIQSVTQRPIKNVIQTDAAINPGNSGGPLLDSAGRLIGMNTAIFSPSGSSAGIGFAIPVDEINQVVPQIIKQKGHMAHPGLGAQIRPGQADARTAV